MTYPDESMKTAWAPRMRRVEMIIHVVGWGLLFCFPFFFTGKTPRPTTTVDYLRSAIVPISFMVVFYANYCWLVKRYLFTRQQWKFLLSNLVLIVVVALVVHLLISCLSLRVVPFPPLRPPRPLWGTIGFFLINGVIYVLVAALSVAIKMTGSWYQVESMRREMEKARTEAELRNLKSQLNPHFLFNTLNNIYSLIAFSPDRAQEAVHGLSRLLRYVLYESSQPGVSLGRDLNFLQDYIALMRIRLPEHVRVEKRIDCANPEIQIAPLLFMSLVENAFKHGVSNDRPSFVRVEIEQVGEEVRGAITNSYFPKASVSDKSGSGIGLVNLEKRLSLLYPNDYTFEYGQVGDMYRANLTIKLSDKK